MKNFRAGNYVNQGYYRSFQPNLINRPWTLDDMEVQDLLGKADRELGRLDMFSHYVPNVALFIRMHVIKEATQSSKIEGTQTSVEEALLEREDVSPEKRDDWEKVQNYIKALNYAIDALKTLPLSNRLIRNTHRVLLEGVRGARKQPGEFRRSQNWIGGATLDDALFVPPVHTSVAELMGDLEKFVHNSTILFPELLKTALLHYQFETIHPFLDGNGRTGRLMITLYLVSKGILQRPVLYLSDFFEQHRSLYYDNLMRVREKNDLKQWFKFFLVGVIETAQKGIQTFDQILKLQQAVQARIQGLGSRMTPALLVIEYLYQQPILDAQKVKVITGLSMPSSYKLIGELEALNILEESTGAKRGKTYVFSEYLALFQS